MKSPLTLQAPITAQATIPARRESPPPDRPAMPGRLLADRGSGDRALAATSLLVLLACGAPSVAVAQVPATSYRVETIATPKGIAPEVSAVAFGPDGRLYACFRRGYIYSMDPATKQWRKFASGLHTPLGILAGKKGEFFVAQIPELTRVADTDGDGAADVYETISDGWGLSGNYHEFIAGPVRDREGNFYISLGLASGGANPRPPTRGEVTVRGRRADQPKEGNVNRVGHYSPVPYRGCAVKISPQGRLSLFACGFRQPNGITISPQDEIFVADNQGDWVGTSPLHHVTEGAFHGHPASLNWDPAFGGRVLPSFAVAVSSASPSDNNTYVHF